MAITQTVEKKTPNGVNMMVHRCECGKKMQHFHKNCPFCGAAYWRHYSRIF